MIAYGQTKWHLDDIEQDIKIEGNLFTPEDMIRGILSQSLYVPIFQLDPSKIAGEVKELESVKHVFVRRYAFPKPGLIVDIKEQFPFASLTYDPAENPQFVITESGSLVPVLKFPSYPRPALKIVAAPKNMKNFTDQDVKQWGKWISYIETQTGETVQTVDLRDRFDAKVTTNKTVLKLGLPDTTLTQRLSRLSSIWELVESYRDRLEYVDLALDNNIPLKVLDKPRVAEKEKEREKTPEKAPSVATTEDDAL